MKDEKEKSSFVLFSESKLKMQFGALLKHVLRECEINVKPLIVPPTDT